MSLLPRDSRFLRKANDRVNEIFECVERVNPRSWTRKGWLTKHRKMAACAHKASFAYHEVGSKSKPAIAFIGVTPEQHEFKTWEEKCLTGQVLMFQYQSDICPEPEPVPFVISHHALARLFMRCSELQAMPTTWEYERLIKLLQPLLNWSVFWDACIRGPHLENAELLKDSSLAYRFFPVIPSPFGLFFCETSYEDPRINVRTFVGNEQLRREQKELQSILQAVGEGFEDLPVSIHPWSFLWGVWHTEIYLLLVLERLFKHGAQIASLVCEGLTASEMECLEKLAFLRKSFFPGMDPFEVPPQEFYTFVLRKFRSLELQARS